MCSDNGKWNRTWMCFLYEIEGYEVAIVLNVLKNKGAKAG